MGRGSLLTLWGHGELVAVPLQHGPAAVHEEASSAQPVPQVGNTTVVELACCCCCRTFCSISVVEHQQWLQAASGEGTQENGGPQRRGELEAGKMGKVQRRPHAQAGKGRGHAPSGGGDAETADDRAPLLDPGAAPASRAADEPAMHAGELST